MKIYTDSQLVPDSALENKTWHPLMEKKLSELSQFDVVFVNMDVFMNEEDCDEGKRINQIIVVPYNNWRNVARNLYRAGSGWIIWKGGKEHKTFYDSSQKWQDS